MMSPWASALSSITPLYAVMNQYYEDKARTERQQEEGRFWVTARLVKHMDAAIDAWNETRSQEAALDAWVKAFEPEFTEDKVKSAFRDTDGEDVWNFACALAAQMVHEWFIPTVWDHLRNPAL